MTTSMPKQVQIRIGSAASGQVQQQEPTSIDGTTNGHNQPTLGSLSNNNVSAAPKRFSSHSNQTQQQQQQLLIGGKPCATNSNRPTQRLPPQQQRPSLNEASSLSHTKHQSSSSLAPSRFSSSYCSEMPQQQQQQQQQHRNNNTSNTTATSLASLLATSGSTTATPPANATPSTPLLHHNPYKSLLAPDVNLDEFAGICRSGVALAAAVLQLRPETSWGRLGPIPVVAAAEKMSLQHQQGCQQRPRASDASPAPGRHYEGNYCDRTGAANSNYRTDAATTSVLRRRPQVAAPKSLIVLDDTVSSVHSDETNDDDEEGPFYAAEAPAKTNNNNDDDGGSGKQQQKQQGRHVPVTAMMVGAATPNSCVSSRRASVAAPSTAAAAAARKYFKPYQSAEGSSPLNLSSVESVYATTEGGASLFSHRSNAGVMAPPASFNDPSAFNGVAEWQREQQRLFFGAGESHNGYDESTAGCYQEGYQEGEAECIPQAAHGGASDDAAVYHTPLRQFEEQQQFAEPATTPGPAQYSYDANDLNGYSDFGAGSPSSHYYQQHPQNQQDYRGQPPPSWQQHHHHTARGRYYQSYRPQNDDESCARWHSSNTRQFQRHDEQTAFAEAGAQLQPHQQQHPAPSQRRFVPQPSAPSSSQGVMVGYASTPLTSVEALEYAAYLRQQQLALNKAQAAPPLIHPSASFSRPSLSSLWHEEASRREAQRERALQIPQQLPSAAPSPATTAFPAPFKHLPMPRSTQPHPQHNTSTEAQCGRSGSDDQCLLPSGMDAKRAAKAVVSDAAVTVAPTSTSLPAAGSNVRRPDDSGSGNANSTATTSFLAAALKRPPPPAERKVGESKEESPGEPAKRPTRPAASNVVAPPEKEDEERLPPTPTARRMPPPPRRIGDEGGARKPTHHNTWEVRNGLRRLAMPSSSSCAAKATPSQEDDDGSQNDAATTTTRPPPPPPPLASLNTTLDLSLAESDAIRLAANDPDACVIDPATPDGRKALCYAAMEAAARPGLPYPYAVEVRFKFRRSTFLSAFAPRLGVPVIVEADRGDDYGFVENTRQCSAMDAKQQQEEARRQRLPASSFANATAGANHERCKPKVKRLATKADSERYRDYVASQERKLMAVVGKLTEKESKVENFSRMIFHGCEFQLDGKKCYLFYSMRPRDGDNGGGSNAQQQPHHHGKDDVTFLPLARLLFCEFGCRVWIHNVSLFVSPARPRNSVPNRGGGGSNVNGSDRWVTATGGDDAPSGAASTAARSGQGPTPSTGAPPLRVGSARNSNSNTAANPTPSSRRTSATASRATSPTSAPAVATSRPNRCGNQNTQRQQQQQQPRGGASSGVAAAFKRPPASQQQHRTNGVVAQPSTVAGPKRKPPTA